MRKLVEVNSNFIELSIIEDGIATYRDKADGAGARSYKAYLPQIEGACLSLSSQTLSLTTDKLVELRDILNCMIAELTEREAKAFVAKVSDET